MSRRGRRRSSKRRKSSSSSKHHLGVAAPEWSLVFWSAETNMLACKAVVLNPGPRGPVSCNSYLLLFFNTPESSNEVIRRTLENLTAHWGESSSTFIFQNQSNNTTVSNKKDSAEKNEENSFQIESELSGFEDQKYGYAPPSQKRCKQNLNMAEFQEQRNMHTNTTEVEEKVVKIVTSVSFNDMEKSSQKVNCPESHEPLSENPTNSPTPATNIFNVNCSGSQVKVEIQEILQGNPYGIKTTCVFMNENKGFDMIIKRECEGMQMSDHQPLEHLTKNVTSHNGNQQINYRFTFGSITEQTKERSDPSSIWSTDVGDDPNYCRCCNDYVQQNLAKRLSGPPLLLDLDPQGKEKYAFSGDQFCHFSTPRIFADIEYNALQNLTNDLADLGIRGPAETASPFSVPEKESEDRDRSFDQFSELDNYEPMFMRRSMSTNRSSFIKEFIYCQKRKSWIRNNSIATVEHKECLLLRKRRQTFPGTSLSAELIHEDVQLPYNKSISSIIMSSLPFQTERTGKNKQFDDRFSTYMRKNCGSSQSGESSKTCSDYSETQGELTGMGLDKEISLELHAEEIIQGRLAIQVIPPSCSGSEEQILQTDPIVVAVDKDEKSFTERDTASSLSEHNNIMTVPVGAPQHNFLQIDSIGSCSRSCLQKSVNLCMSPPEETDMNSLKKHDVAMEIESNPPEQSVSSPPLLLTTDEMNNQKVPKERNPEDSNKATDGLLCAVKASTDIVLNARELPVKAGKAEAPTVYRSNSEAKEHLKPAPHKDRDSTDHWARKRKLFKESRQWSSTGGSSITSDITEESVSEDTLSTNVTVQDNEDRGFYAETFQSSAWIYQGDDIGTGAICPNLTDRTRAISIRERTVQINKGTGEYPWGFRIQFSKPIVVTEVDTNGAAEEAGLMVGDYVLAVNGIDVTSIPHSEAANLARQGPDILTLTIGSDIARGPNIPRPPCRGYLHKRTQSGLIKGWRKRWFVLTHDCCLHYYKNKRDEGKRQPLSSAKLEGAEVGPDDSLGKPFVFKCRPQSGSRVYFLCATSNQERKRWLEAMERAIHPITQNHVWIDVTKHNSNMPPLAVKNPDCLGLLNKMDKNKDTWIQHYCILKDACLYLYSGIRATHAHGGIYLQGYAVREQAYGSKKSTIELKPPSDEFKTFYFCADNSAENKRWILAMKASIKKWRPFHQVLQDYMSLPPEETRM